VITIHPFDECLTHSSHWELETNSISNNFQRLLQAIQRFVKLTHEMFTSFLLRILGLFHVNLLLMVTIEKCGFDIDLMDLHVFEWPPIKDTTN
jgi:hypothetical protein